MRQMKTLRPVLLGFLALSVSIGSSGCKVFVAYEQPWYNVFGNYCGQGYPRPGCNFYSDGTKIVDIQDPYYGSRNYEWGIWTYYDSYGQYTTHIGWGWLSPTGVLYNFYGYALNENQGQDSRDLIANAAAVELETVNAAGRRFAQKHALAEATGIRIAETLNKMSTLPKRLNRARTQADLADFTRSLYGIDLNLITVAAEMANKGDLSLMRELNQEVAREWGTQPETSEAILRAWYGNQL